MNIAENHSDKPSRQTVFDYVDQESHWNDISVPQYMPWGHGPNAPAAPLVTFTAEQPHGTVEANFNMHRSTQQQASTSSFYHHCHRPSNHFKRKAELDNPVPAKQHITEERMAAHMSRLHISTESSPQLCIDEEPISREKRLYVCEEMRRLQTESILPTSLLGRLERPCMAVMLWQPPTKIPEELLPPATAHIVNIHQQGGTVAATLEPGPDHEPDNNNSSTLDLNNMDMDT